MVYRLWISIGDSRIFSWFFLHNFLTCVRNSCMCTCSNTSRAQEHLGCWDWAGGCLVSVQLPSFGSVGTARELSSCKSTTLFSILGEGFYTPPLPHYLMKTISGSSLACNLLFLAYKYFVQWHSSLIIKTRNNCKTRINTVGWSMKIKSLVSLGDYPDKDSHQLIFESLSSKTLAFF